ncbi:MAG: glycosyltransferase family 39 protein [Candidatus Sulfobium sp.]
MLALWVLLVMWLRPWRGDLYHDPLTYACISKDMLEHGHWFSPMLNGAPYLNKPPLYFWLTAISFKVFGISYYTAKLPSLLFATVDVFFLYWIVYRWFDDRDLAFFSAFAFATTRWIVRNFASNRPESLLVFSVLLGCYALTLMNEKNGKGPYLLGLSFATGIMAKLFFALFLPAAVLVYGFTRRRIKHWMKWSHFYYGCLGGLLMSSVWFVYFESRFPGFLHYITDYQTLQRVTQGMDVKADQLEYIRELATFYYPWLVFLVPGIPLLWRRMRESDYLWFVFVALVVMLVPLQISEGKASRYLTVVTPFLSVVTGLGVIRFERSKKFMRGFATYTVVPLLIFFWIIPVNVNPEKFHVLHTAEDISRAGKTDYRDFFAFLGQGNDDRRENLRFVEWTPEDPGAEYRLASYFYLSGSFISWGRDRLAEWERQGTSPVLMVTQPGAGTKLMRDGAIWIEIDRDRYNSLLVGIPRR